MENETRVISEPPEVDDAEQVDVLALLGIDNDKPHHRLADPWLPGISGNPAGRPCKQIPSPAIIEKLAAHFTEREIAAIAGVAPQTWARRKQTNPALVDALARGRAQAKAAPTTFIRNACPSS